MKVWVFVLAVAVGIRSADGGQRERVEAPPAVVSPVDAARGVLERLIPARASSFVMESIPGEGGKDVFEIESREGKIVLRGCSGVAICSALNWYLKYFCRAHVSWCGSQLSLPHPLPQVKEKIRRVSPHRWRYFFNYCCFGYSLPWWDWPQWERMIDWMALSGINMPLAVTGQEATWRAVLRDAGLEGEVLRDFLAGPPYLPFGWMGCLDGWGGPLPKNWIDRRAELQKKILARERALGMKPVLQGFTGHIPEAIREKFPSAKLHEIRWVEWKTSILDPLDPLFQRLGKSFIQNQTREFGTDHLYASDTFIEMTPPSKDPDFLASIGRALYESMAAGDPEAVWVLQGWIFVFNPNFWQAPQARAFLGSVPDDRMILLDLYCEYAPAWSQTQAFYGKPWLWCVIQNFGNTTKLSGPLAKINSDLHGARTSSQGGKLSGIGMVQEGLGCNPVVFDFMTEMAWHGEPVDLNEWIRQYAQYRYGRECAKAEEAWTLLRNTVYTTAHGASSPICLRPNLAGRGYSIPPYDQQKFVKAWDLLVQCAEELGSPDTFLFDLVNVSRQALSNYSNLLFGEILAAFMEKDQKGLSTASGEFLQLIRDLDTLLATREEFLLGRWLEDAKRWGESEAEKAVLEWNARNIITLWGERTSVLHDYARKEWSGLLGKFYLPRWQMFLEGLDRALEEGRDFDSDAYAREIQQWEEDWTHQRDAYPVRPAGDAVEVSRTLFKKYKKRFAGLLIPHMAMGKPATASSTHHNYHASRAVDGNAYDRDSSWQADPYPQWLQIDLEKPVKVSRIHVYPYWDGQRYYRYTVEVSMDGKAWKQVADMSQNSKPATPRGDLYIFGPVEARYVRVNMLFNSANTGVHIVEVKVYGEE